MSAEKQRLLCITHLPPPVNGVTVMGESVANSRLLNSRYRLSVLPLFSSTSISDIGRVRPAKLLGIVRFIRDLSLACMREKPRLAYFTVTPTGKAFYRDLLYVAVLKLFRVPRLFHLHGKGIAAASSSAISRLFYRWAFRRAQVILLSPLLYEDCALFVRRGDCFFLANGIASPEIPFHIVRESRAGAESPVILFFSNIAVIKGPFVLLDALALIKRRGIPFHALFAGEWHTNAVAESFRETLVKHDLAEDVEYLGSRYGKDKEEAYAMADVMAFPTYNDAYPLVILEAMARGLPVVSTTEGAIPEIVLDGLTGFLVPAGDHEALADRLAKLLTDPAMRASMGEAGRRRFMEHYTFQRFEEGLCDIFENCIDSPV